MTLGASGQLQGGMSKADETRKRLAAAQDRVVQTAAAAMAPGGDVMSAEEIAAAFNKKGRKKVRWPGPCNAGFVRCCDAPKAAGAHSLSSLIRATCAAR